MNLTSIIRPVFNSRLRAIEQYDSHAEEIQRSVLDSLLHAAADTEWGHRFKYDTLHSYEEFAAKYL